MRAILGKSLFAILTIFCCTSLARANDKKLDFNIRVDRAKKIERQAETQLYFKSQMYPAIGSHMSSAMRDCLAKPHASTDKFTVVADITQEGTFVNVGIQPLSDTAECFAIAMGKFHVPPPPTCEYTALPIMMDMAIKP